MSQVVPIRGEDTADTTDIVNALDAEIDNMWGLVACLQTIFTEHSGDPYVKGALRIANNHLDALGAIRRDLDGL